MGGKRRGNELKSTDESELFVCEAWAAISYYSVNLIIKRRKPRGDLLSFTEMNGVDPISCDGIERVGGAEVGGWSDFCGW